MQNSVISTRVTSLYGSQPSPVVIACKRATFGPELQVSMCPRLHLSFCTCKTLWLAPELLVSMGPSPHLWLLHAKQRLLDHNNKSLWIPAIICGFCIQKSDFCTRVTSLYGFHTSPVVLCMDNIVISTRITSLYGTQTSPVIVYMENSVISTRITRLSGSHTSPLVCARKTSWLALQLEVSMGPRPNLSFCTCKIETFGPE